MAVRSRRVWDPHTTTLAIVDVYTVPVVRTLLLRTLWFHNPTAGTITVVVRGRVPGGATTHLASVQLATGISARIGDESIWNPGDVIAINSTVAGAIVWGFGSLLDGAPQ